MVLFQGFHYQVDTATDYSQILDIPTRESFKVAVIEHVRPPSELEDVARLIRRRWSKARILIVSNVTPSLEDALYDERVDPLNSMS
jgi:DNA-binding response OmpR family regulator